MIERSITQSQALSKRAKAENAKETAGYVKEITRELANLTESVELTKLTHLLTVASLEAQLCCYRLTDQEHINAIPRRLHAKAR